MRRDQRCDQDVRIKNRTRQLPAGGVLLVIGERDLVSNWAWTLMDTDLHGVRAGCPPLEPSPASAPTYATNA
jgi:hypothetical protein